MRALPLALAAAAATSFLELLPEPSMVCDNSKCRLEGEELCLREYAIDRDCSTFGAPYVALDDALAACARHENCSGVYDPGCDCDEEDEVSTCPGDTRSEIFFAQFQIFLRQRTAPGA